MSITGRDDLVDAMGNGGTNSPLLSYIKNSIGNQASGGYTSLWKAPGFPFTGSNPGAAAPCDRTTVGCFQAWTNPTAPARKYLALWTFTYQNAGGEVQLHDRISHVGGLSGTATTLQTVGVDASVGTNNVPNRIGLTDYSELQWWAEWYTDTGSSAVTATFDVVYNDASTGQITLGVGATTRASRVFPLRSGVASKYIKSITSVTLSATTGTAGSWGVTVTRPLAIMQLGLGNTATKQHWGELALPRIFDDACLFFILLPTAVGTINNWGFLRLVEK